MPCRPVRVPAALRSPLVIGFAALVGTLAVAPAAHADLSAPKPKPGPTVTFVGGGPAPFVCTSQPEPPSITIPWNSWLNVVNHTGADATLWLREKPFPLADGAGRAFKFTVSGPYTIELVPECLVTVGDAVPLAVEVGLRPDEDGSAPTTPPTGTPSTSGDARRQPASGATPPIGLASGDRAGSDGPDTGASPAATDGTGDGPPDLPELAPDEEYEMYGPFNTGQTGQGIRLLAIIAAICVFGVSVAIIRVILAQRATKSVSA